MSRLLLVRHGETELNSVARYWGSTDVALSADGIRQAEQLSRRLAAEPIDSAYTSSQKRAEMTARTIAREHKIEVAACPELREIDFGQLEGLTYDEIRQQHPQVARLWEEQDPRLSYPGGESLETFDRRLSGFLPRLENFAAGETILIVAHAGSLRLLICRLLGLDKKHLWQI
ncbi:histidine phosphatase family protein, partial [Chloroflexota bacterium]